MWSLLHGPKSSDGDDDNNNNVRFRRSYIEEERQGCYENSFFLVNPRKYKRNKFEGNKKRKRDKYKCENDTGHNFRNK